MGAPLGAGGPGAPKPQQRRQKARARVSLPETATGVSLIVNRASEAAKEKKKSKQFLYCLLRYYAEDTKGCS